MASNRNEQVHLAFDLGASSGRAILGRVGPQRQIKLEEVHRFGNAPVKTDKGLFWDIEALFEQMLQAMRLVSDRGVPLRSIGVDTWGVDFALLDENGELLDRPICYRDSRNIGMSRRIVERIGATRLSERTGSMFQDHASLCQLAAAAEDTPVLLSRAATLLFIPDLLRQWLCGSLSTDCTVASTSQMYDAVRREWATDILAELNLPGKILPSVAIGPSIAGSLIRDIQKKTGLGSVPVVVGAGHDTGAAFGLCLDEDLPPPEDLVVVSSGTWSILGIFVDEYLPAGALEPTRFGYEANPDGSLRIVCNLTGAWLIEQCRKVWSAEGVDCSYEALIAAARATADEDNASAIIDPQWEGFTHPSDMPAAVAEYCRDTDQPVPRTPGEFAQVIFVSLAESYAQAIAELREKTGKPLRNLYVIGGMSRNKYLNELTSGRADVLVSVGPAEAAATGNVAVQMQAMET
ncbi:MAG: FGGY family carbohydrate kinase [Planctomycetota bacterium]|nr:FGGY family carbohydrate kinase [Planctomycetota bacterium]